MIDKIRKVSQKTWLIQTLRDCINTMDDTLYEDPKGFSWYPSSWMAQFSGKMWLWRAQKTFRVLIVWHILYADQKE